MRKETAWRTCEACNELAIWNYGDVENKPGAYIVCLGPCAMAGYRRPCTMLDPAEIRLLRKDKLEVGDGPDTLEEKAKLITMLGVLDAETNGGVEWYLRVLGIYVTKPTEIRRRLKRELLALVKQAEVLTGAEAFDVETKQYLLLVMLSDDDDDLKKLVDPLPELSELV